MTQIGLGLDLKGGMNVILEISVPDVLENLADHISLQAPCGRPGAGNKGCFVRQYHGGG